MSSSKPTSGRKARVNYSPRQKRQVVRSYRASGMTREAFCAENNVSVSSLDRWLALYKERAEEVAPPPDHDRDINALVAMNTKVDLALAQDEASADERVAKILGATIAEVLRRMRG